ncbi:MAG: hypothetical protein U1E03_02875 [Hyphomonadaceae bacterium]
MIDAWSSFKDVVGEIGPLMARAKANSERRPEELLGWLNRLELAYLALRSNAAREQPEDSSASDVWREWFDSFKEALPELATYNSVHPTSSEWTEVKLRAAPDEFALLMMGIDRALALEVPGGLERAAAAARQDYEQGLGARLASLRVYIYHECFKPAGND